MCGHGPSFIQLLVVNNKQFRSYSSQRWGPKIRLVLLNPLSSWTGIPVVEAGSELPHKHLSQRLLCYGGQLSAIPSFLSLSLPSPPFSSFLFLLPSPSLPSPLISFPSPPSFPPPLPDYVLCTLLSLEKWSLGSPECFRLLISVSLPGITGLYQRT